MDVASVTCKTVRSNAQLQEQLTGRQVKGKGHIALEYIVFVAQLGGVIALESRESEETASGGWERILFGSGLRDVGSKYMRCLITAHEKPRNSHTVDTCFGCV